MKKINLLHSILILGLLFLASCKGPAGETGPAGPAGVKGDAGAAGVAGKDGGINFQASDWKYFDFSKNVGKVSNNLTTTPLADKTETQYFTMTEPILNKEAIDKGFINMYFKSTAATVYSVSSTGGLTPNLTTRFILPYPAFSRIEFPIKAVNLNTLDFGITVSNNAQSSIEVFNSYFKNVGTNDAQIDMDVIKKIFGNTLQYRIVVLTGTSKGRLAHLNMQNYEEVKVALNLKD
jgi:hypothetical protein